jgi:hypothetical protein
MAELNADSLGAGTWEDEIGGVIPKGTSTTPQAALAAAITLTEMSLAVFGDPDQETRDWTKAGETANRVLDACDLRHVMTRHSAAELLERVAIGSDDDVAAKTVARILAEPAYAWQVWTEARDFLDTYHRADTDLSTRVDVAAVILKLQSAVAP